MIRRNIVILLAAAAVVATMSFVWGRIEADDPATQTVSGNVSENPIVAPASFSDVAKMGERAFNASCAACHGANAGGTDVGPPLIHRIYEPSHHSDYAFELAVANGVRAHHWRFGNMPPRPGLTRADVASIITYVRELQRANGIN